MHRPSWLQQSTAFVLLMGLLLSTGCIPNEPKLVDPIVVKGGSVEGAQIPGTSVRVYKGIPYAAPPIEALRWKPPQPVTPWEGVLQAHEFSDACMQQLSRSRPPWTEAFMHQGDASEDCLYLNVWTAAEHASEKRPVMVWLHGGGLQEGSTAVATYDGTEFARRGVVLVSINYRLGLLGFMAHPELTAESPHGSSGQYGFHDQVAALKWIQQNISAFGGDPENVTVFGQSAGAMSIRTLLKSPLAENLFVRGILQSGSESMPPSMANAVSTLQQAEQSGVSIQQQLGANSLAELRQLPADRFVMPGSLSLANLEDGWLLPEGGSEYRPISMMAGMVANDWIWGLDPSETAEAYAANILEDHGELASMFLELYPALDDSLVLDAREHAIRDRGRIALKNWADRLSERSPSLYTYFFDRAIPWPAQPQFGAFHSVELPYVFNTINTLDRPWEEADSILAERMIKYWVNFASSGNPNGEGLPEWTAYTDAPGTLMRLGAEPGMEPIGLEHIVSLWEQVLQEQTGQ